MNHEHKPLSATQLALVDQMTDALLDAGLTVCEARQVCAALRSRVERQIGRCPFGPSAFAPAENLAAAPADKPANEPV